VRKRSPAPIIAMSGLKMLKNTLELSNLAWTMWCMFRFIFARFSPGNRGDYSPQDWRAAAAVRDQHPGFLQWA